MMEIFYPLLLVYILQSQQMLHSIDARFGQAHCLELFVSLIIPFWPQARNNPCKIPVPFRRFLVWSRNDQRSARLIYKNGVSLVYYGKMLASLNLRVQVIRHVIPQIIKPELVIGAVRDIRSVGFLP